MPERQCPAWPSSSNARTLFSSFPMSLRIQFLWDMEKMCNGDWLETGVLNIFCYDELLLLPYWSRLLALSAFWENTCGPILQILAWGALDIWSFLLGPPRPTVNVRMEGRVLAYPQYFLWPCSKLTEPVTPGWCHYGGAASVRETFISAALSAPTPATCWQFSLKVSQCSTCFLEFLFHFSSSFISLHSSLPPSGRVNNCFFSTWMNPLGPLQGMRHIYIWLTVIEIRTSQTKIRVGHLPDAGCNPELSWQVFLRVLSGLLFLKSRGIEESPITYWVLLCILEYLYLRKGEQESKKWR